MRNQPRPRWALPFFIIWTGEAISLIGSSLAQFAIVWWLTKTTGSATVLAMATLAAILPGILLGPLAGAYVDRWDRRAILIVADGISALAAACLALLFWSGTAQVWHVYLIMAVRSIGGTFQWPAMQASTALMVPERHLARLAGLNQTLQGTMNIVAPPLGALLLTLLPLQGIMGIDVVTAAFAIVPLLFVNIPQPPRVAASPGEQGKPSVWADVRAGLRYVWHWPGLVVVVCMATVINFLMNPAFALVPILVTRHLGGQALELGWMNSTFGAGTLLGGVTLGVWGGFRQRIVTTLAALSLSGVGVLLLGLVPPTGYWLAVGAMAAVGFTLPIVNGPIFALLQSVVAPEMHGRVFTVVGSLSAAMSPLGLAVAGPVADALGVQTWYILGGAACVLMGLCGFLIPPVLHIEDRLSRASAAASELSLSASAQAVDIAD